MPKTSEFAATIAAVVAMPTALFIALGCAGYIANSSDAVYLNGWKTLHVSGPVKDVRTLNEQSSNGRFGVTDTPRWAWFTSGSYVVLNGRIGADALCAGLFLNGVTDPGVSLSAMEAQSARAVSDVAMTLRVPRPSETVSSAHCDDVKEKADHFEFGGRTVAFATQIEGLAAPARQAGDSMSTVAQTSGH